MKQPEIVRLLKGIKRGEELIARGHAPMAVYRNIAQAKCAYWRMRKLRIV